MRKSIKSRKSVISGSGVDSQDPADTFKDSSESSENDEVLLYDGEQELKNLIQCFLDVPDILGIKAKIEISKDNNQVDE